MIKFVPRLAAAVVLSLLLAHAASAASEGYLDYVSTAVSAVEAGKYDQAVQAVDKAFAVDVNEPLAHTVLATIFAHTNQIDAAAKEYKAALSLDNGYPLAAYGLAMCMLAKGKQSEAQILISGISAPSRGVEETLPVKVYLEVLKGSFSAVDAAADKSTDPLTAGLAALALFKRGDPDKADAALKLLAMKNAKPGYFEPLGAVITLDKRVPIRFTGQPMTLKYAPPKLNDTSLPQISGRVTLRADLSKAVGVKYVVFSVDNRMVGMVNHPPYEYEWNTLTVPNGPHSIKIEGHSEQGLTLSDKSTRVRVANAKPLYGGAIEGTQADEIASRLWQCLKLRPSMASTYYTLGKLALGRKDNEEARNWFERAMAVNPDYQDVRSQIIKLDGRTSGFREVWSVPGVGKTIALTFDDGPHAGTDRLLQVLKSKGVKATFFVVGSQAEANPDLVRKMAEDGHDIENHTYSHRNLEALSASEIEKEIFKTSVVIRDITGKRPPYFRCPHGRLNGTVGEVADRYGFKGIFWTVNCSKFEGSVPTNIINYVVAKATDGGIVLMHNVEDVTLMALPGVIDGLKTKGYKFATISDMLSRR